jgi:hypothetical protein
VQDLRELPHALTASLQHTFDVPQVALRLWNVAGAHSGTVYTMGVSDDAKAFASSLTMPFCGPNMGFEPVTWLPNPNAVQSVALLTLHDGAMDSTSNAFGMLVLGSPDPLRFDATMGLEFSPASPSWPVPRSRACAPCADAGARLRLQKGVETDARARAALLRSSTRSFRKLSTAIWSMCVCKSAWPSARIRCMRWT